MTSEGILLSSNEQKNHICDQENPDILESLDNLMLNVSLNKNMHLDKLDKVLQNSGPSSVLKFIQKCSNPEVKPLVLKRLQVLAVMSVKEGPVNAIDMFNVEEEGLNQQHVVDILSDAFGNLPLDILKKILCDIIIPEMFNNNNFSKKVHDIIIDVGFRLIEKFPITNLDNEEIKLFSSRVIEKYSKILESLRERNYNRWHDLWIFFVRFLGKHLHVAMDLANKLLRVVEYAFRNPSYEQRLKGYDCWKELIDNASLDLNHLCSNKQIKLLVTPLRAKFSKMEIVICKRFEVFLYLLEKLQKQSILCLNEFLEFCFGVSNNVNSCSKNGQGKLVPNLWLKSIQVFLAILGDQTSISEVLNRKLFEEAVIDASNINKFGNLTVCAVIECSIILKQISIPSQEKILILTSLWEALFDILVKTTTEIQEQCFQKIFDSLSTIFKVYNEEVTYVGLYTAFNHILESSIDQRLINDSLKLLLEYALKFLGEVDVSHEFSQQLFELIQFVSKEIHMIDFLLEQFKKIEASRNESKLYTIWNILGTKLIEDFNITNHLNLIIHFFLWPVHHLQNLGEQISVDTCSAWLQLFIKASRRFNSTTTIVLDEYEKCLKSNPLLSDNIATLIGLLAQSKMDFSVEFVNKILRLVMTIMSMPLLPQETSEKMYDMVLKCTNFVATCSTDDIGSEMMNNLNQCIEKIRSHQKNPHLVEVLENILTKKIIRQSSAAVEKRKKSSSAMVSSQDPIIGTPTGVKRSLRMTQMAFTKESSSNDNKDKINALKSFGKDIETMSPWKVKGSVLQNMKNTTSNSNSRSRKMINSVKKPLMPEPPFIEDHSSDYVLINSEVKLQKDKLTEHQVEEMKRRREDIPALYQDLSQSQTQSLSLNSKDITGIPADANPDNCNENVKHKYHLETEPSPTEAECHASKNSDKIKTPIEQNDAVISHFGYADLMNRKGKESMGKIEKELRKIQMNIVGGDTFLENLPSKRTRRAITPIPTKKQKKTEEEIKINKDNDDISDHEFSSQEKTKCMKSISDVQEESHGMAEEIDTTKKKLFVSIEKISDDSLEENLNEHREPTSHSNNRKNKFIKPKKHIVTPKSDKKSKSEATGTPTSTKKTKQDKIKIKKIIFQEANNTTEKVIEKKSLPDDIQSEIMFESEIDIEKKRNDKVRHVKTTNKSEETYLPKKGRQSDDVTESVEIISKQENDTKGKINNIEKYKKRPKEIMKKNKEKVRKIQSQLKLASLSDLTDSSEPKKIKGEKLLFIREITKSKHNENTKLAPAGLKRNRDKKSSSIAYSIEPPDTSVDLVSLNLSLMQSSMKKSNSVGEVLSDTVLEKPAKKRKRTNSVNSSPGSLSASESPSIENNQEVRKKIKLKRNSINEKGVKSIKSSEPMESLKNQESDSDSKKSSRLETKTQILTNQGSPALNMVESKKISSTKKNSALKSTTVSSTSLESPSRITRSRASSLSPMDQSNSTSSKMKNNAKNEHTKAVVKLLFEESEDIIESSQDSILENTTGNLSKSKNKHSPKTHIIPLKDKSENEVLSAEEEQKVSVGNTVEEITIEVERLNAEGGSNGSFEKTKCEAVSQADTLTCDSNVEPQPIIVDLDLPKKPELTESERILSTTDTVSIVSQTSEEGELVIGNISVLDVDGKNENLNHVADVDNINIKSNVKEESKTEQDIEVGTPCAQRSRDLPGSPVSNVTPTLTRELLNNTMDISPISSQLLEEDRTRENEIEKNLDEALERAVAERVESRPTNDCESDDKAQLSLNLRSDRLLNMVNVASPLSRKKMAKKVVSSPAPVNSRYEKLLSFFNGNKEDECRANKKKDDSEAGTENIEDVLTFSREVPSPYALPSSGILKRKLTDVEEGFSPCAKRKRVNFSYPCISSTKLYIRHKEELNNYCPPSIAQKLFGDDYDDDSADEDPFANPDVRYIETEESMDVSNSLMLCRRKPIYEQLVNCTENIDILWKRLSSPTYSELLQKLMASKKIHTIGDLASLSEVQINRLPFKQPRIKTVRKALNFYFTNVYKKIIDVPEVCSVADSEMDNQTVEHVDEISKDVPEETSETNSEFKLEDNLKEQFTSILTNIKNQKIPLEEFGATLLDLVEESELIGVLKSVYNTDFRKFFEKCHWRYLIETIVQCGGTSEIFNIMSDLAEKNETFANQLESLVQLRISQKPLKEIISQRSLLDLKEAIQNGIDCKVLNREEVMQSCLVPLIKNPSDIKFYFSNLTIVQIHELFVERVQPADLSLFLEQIREHYGNYTVAQCANRSDVLKLCSKEELITSLIEKKDMVQSAIELISKINDQDKLLSLYDYIGTLIPPAVRREKFIEFLNNIPLNDI